jgi:hypothetical protein
MVFTDRGLEYLCELSGKTVQTTGATSGNPRAPERMVTFYRCDAPVLAVDAFLIIASSAITLLIFWFREPYRAPSVVPLHPRLRSMRDLCLWRLAAPCSFKFASLWALECRFAQAPMGRPRCFSAVLSADVKGHALRKVDSLYTETNREPSRHQVLGSSSSAPLWKSWCANENENRIEI